MDMKSRLTVLDPFAAVMGEQLNALAAPLWTPWPVPLGWSFTGCGSLSAESLDEGVQAEGTSTVASWSGHDPFGDPIEVLFVCEEAGSGLGADFTGLDTHYPPGSVGEGPPHAKFMVEGRPVPLWSVEGAAADRAAFAGEAAGRWLWVILHPAEAGAIMIQPMTLVDARQLGAELAVVPVAELSPRLLVD